MLRLRDESPKWLISLEYLLIITLVLSSSGGFGAVAQKCSPLPSFPNSIISYDQPDLLANTIATISCQAGYELIGSFSSINNSQRRCLGGKWIAIGMHSAGKDDDVLICAINIAIRQTAYQTSNSTETTFLQGSRQAYESAAYLAVDGTDIYCSRTLHESKPSWNVLFEKEYPIVAIKILADSHDMNEIQVTLLATVDRQIDDEKAKSPCRVQSISGQENVTVFLCNPHFKARQVLIEKRSASAGYLKLCEVNVFSQQGVACQHPGSPRNGIVKLSHVDWPFPPGAVAVYDCNAGYTRIPSEASFHRTCLINGTWDSQEPVCVVNVGLFKMARQSSLFSNFNYPAWQAIDGDLNSCAWTRRERQPWIQIDLLIPYTVHAISVLLDKERLFYQFHRTVFVIVSNTSENPLMNEPSEVIFEPSVGKDVASGSGTFHLLSPVVAQFVTIFATSSMEKFMGICDVQVLASDEIPPVVENCGLQTSPTSFMFSFKHTCYQVQRFTTTSWYNAVLSCQDNGGTLINTADPATALFLTNLLNGLYRYHNSDDRYWIGARMSRIDSTWVYSTKNETFPIQETRWAPGRPTNDGPSREFCVAFGGQGISNWTWADYRCGQDVANWICSYAPRKCPDPIQPEASALLVADKTVGIHGWKIGDLVQYECAPGYVLVGATHTFCQPDGTWSTSQPSCQLVNCGMPPKPAHLHYSLLNGTTLYNAMAQYYCIDENSRLVGKGRINCLANGIWEDLESVGNIMCETTFLPTTILNTNSGLLSADSASVSKTEQIVRAVESKVEYGMRNSETVGIGVGAALALLIVLAVAIYFAIRYQRRKASRPPTPPKPQTQQRTNYSTIKLQASQISAPIAQSDLTIQISSLSISDNISEPESSLSPSSADTNTTYLKSFGRAGLINLYNKAAGTVRGDIGTQRIKERPRVPKLVISSPIECRKTIVFDTGKTGTEVIYAQPANKVLPVPNHYEYLETNRVRGGYGYDESRRTLDEGIYADTSLSGGSSSHGAVSEMELYDDVINHVSDVINKFNSARV